MKFQNSIQLFHLLLSFGNKKMTKFTGSAFRFFFFTWNNFETPNKWKHTQIRHEMNEGKQYLYKTFSFSNTQHFFANKQYFHWIYNKCHRKINKIHPYMFFYTLESSIYCYCLFISMHFFSLLRRRRCRFLLQKKNSTCQCKCLLFLLLLAATTLMVLPDAIVEK